MNPPGDRQHRTGPSPSPRHRPAPPARPPGHRRDERPGRRDHHLLGRRPGPGAPVLHPPPPRPARAVIAAAEDPAATSPSAAGTVSRRSLLADNANLRERNRRLEHHARGLEQRLSELLGTQISQRTGLGAPDTEATLREQAESLRQQILDLRKTLGERDEELAAAREANRRMMAELNRR